MLSSAILAESCQRLPRPLARTTVDVLQVASSDDDSFPACEERPLPLPGA
jgi:hypothetical protein